MKLSPFWLNLLKEARDAATLQLAKDVVSAFTAEAEAYTLYEELKDLLEAWEIWGCQKAQESIEKFTEALSGWYKIIDHLYEGPDDIWDVLSIEIDVVKHACFTRQAHLSRMIATLMTEQEEWNTKYLNQLGLQEAATLFEEEKQEGEDQDVHL